MKNALVLFLTGIISLCTFAFSSPTPYQQTYGLQTVHQFPPGHWIENMVSPHPQTLFTYLPRPSIHPDEFRISSISTPPPSLLSRLTTLKAVRSTGEILATDLAASTLYIIDPNNPSSAPQPLHHFPNTTLLTGITELAPDIFYLQSVAGDISTFTFQPHSNIVWKIDLRAYDVTGIAVVHEVVRVKEAKLLNGMCILSATEGTLLMADSQAGVLWKLCARTGVYEVAADHELLKPTPQGKPAFGINGVHVVGGLLYFSNTNRGLLARVPVSKRGVEMQDVKIMSRDVLSADDFAVDGRDGSVWLTLNTGNRLVHVFEDGRVDVIAGGGNSTELLSPVSAVWGRTERDRDVLYVGTDGLSVDSETKTMTTNGKIVKIETGRLRGH